MPSRTMPKLRRTSPSTSCRRRTYEQRSHALLGGYAEELLVRFDQLVARRGLAKNRSEVVRDLVRDALVEDECSTPGMEVVGTLTIVFDHHASDLQEKLHAIQHDYFESIISSMHVHLDAHHCLEVIVLRGETGLVQDIANLILGTKGVKNGRLVVTTTGQHI